MPISYLVWAGSSPPTPGLYAQELVFRRDALWSHARDDAEIRFADEDADTTTHVSALDGERFIGSVVFIRRGKDQHGSGRLCQMAVAPDYQGSGIGRELVRRLERHLKETSETPVKVEVHAQLSAVGFYEKVGYEAVDGESDFEEEGIMHRLFSKTITPDKSV